MAFARVSQGRVVEIFEGVAGIFHPDFIAECIECDSSVTTGWAYDGSGFSAPVVEEISAHDAAMNELRALDAYLPRFAEDIITATGIDETALPQIMQDRLSAKRAAREVVRS